MLESLRKYTAPQEKRSKAGRKNHKRTDWLRGQSVEWVRDRAFGEGFLPVERPPGLQIPEVSALPRGISWRGYPRPAQVAEYGVGFV